MRAAKPGMDPRLGLLAELDIPAIEADLGGLICGWNRAAAALYGRHEREMLGRSVKSVGLAPADEAIAGSVVRSLLEMGRWRGELEIRHATGFLLRLDVRARVVLDRGGQPTGFEAAFIDLTDRVSAERRASEIESRLRLAHRVAALGSWEWDPANDRLITSDSFTSLLGLPPGTELTMAMALSAMAPEDRDGVQSAIDGMRSSGSDIISIEYRVRGADGQLRWLEAHCGAIRDPDGLLIRIWGTTQDVTERVRAGDRLQEAGEFWQATIDSLTARVAVLDEHGAIVAVNAAWRRFAQSEADGSDDVGSNYIAGCEAADDPLAQAVGRGLGEILAGDQEVFELEYPRHGPSAERWFVMRATRHEGSGPRRVVVAHDNVTELRESERALLSARNYLNAVTDSIGEGVLAIDVDGCTSYMNRAATELLGWSAAELMGRPLHSILHGLRPEGAVAVADCPMLRAGRGGQLVRVEDDLFARRDGTQLPVAYTASPFATDDGVEGCVVVFEDITERQAIAERVERDLEKLAWLQRVEDALTDDHFVLFAQPIIDLHTSEVVQRELLIRMRSPDATGAVAELIAPGCFLPVAEEYGLVTEIDRWVIDRCAEIAATGQSVEVNLSARSVSDPKLVDYIMHAINRLDADPAKIVFEITETTLISDEQAAQRFVEALHDLGCSVALDDFGTGHCGFSYLKRLPVDFLKIDIEFVRDLVTSQASRHVVQAVVSLAAGFGMKTVGEGVEDQATLELLRELGVDYAQGFHIGRPSPLQLQLQP